MTRMAIGFALLALTVVSGQVSIPAKADTLVPDFVIDPTITINGTSTASAAAGTQKNGMPTTAEQVKEAATYGGKYNGPTVFTADYTINWVFGESCG